MFPAASYGGYPSQAVYGAPVFPGSPGPRPAPAAPPRSLAAAPQTPKVRAQAPDDPPCPRQQPTPAPVSLPSPEQLGIHAPPARPAAGDVAAVDWNATRRRLHEMGASTFQLERLAEGGYRFACWLPGERQGAASRVEATAGSESEAVRLGLERAGRVGAR